MPDVRPENLPFDEAIAFLRDKVPLPTGSYTDLMGAMHSRAFVIAGGMRDELVSDMQAAVLDAIENGLTIEEFRKDFDQIVQRYGWDYRGGRGWRTATIFNTNVRTANAAGHYKQMSSEPVLAARPYWRYVGGLSANPRPLHLQWSGTILRADDPWWQTHYPPNGWGCKCQVVSVSRSEMERDGLEVSERPSDGSYEWTNRQTGEVMRVPNGLDPGWDYNPGRAAWGEFLSHDTMAAWRAQGAAAFESLAPENWENYGLDERLPLLEPGTSPDYSIQNTPEAMEAYLKDMFGGDEKVFTFEDRDFLAFRHDVHVNAQVLASHVDPARSPYLPLLQETIESPQEIWLSFEQHKGTGQVFLRQRFIRALDLGDKKGMIFVTQAVNGRMEAWTVLPVRSATYVNRQRTGRLLWKE